MEARELRVGNLIYDKYGNICTVEWLSKQSLTVNKINFPKKYFIEYSLNKIQPIPLTEEILLKSGYITCSFRENHFVIKGHTIWKCNDLLMCDKNGMVLKYLHQLQNLYYALTNKELTINL